MKKRQMIALLCVASMLFMAACGNKPANTQVPESQTAVTETEPVSDAQTSETAAETGEIETTATEDGSQMKPSASGGDGAVPAVRVGSLKGPTSMGLVSLMDKNERSESEQFYVFDMVTAADELVAKISSGAVDIALVPANVASVLYNKTQGGVSVININTLGVLYIVESGDTIKSIADLKGKTIYLTGKGTTPDYVLSYLLAGNGLTEADVTLEYKSEATEVAAILAEDENAIGLLPQPFVTVACSQNEKLHIALDLTEEWSKLQGDAGSQLVTGVTLVRNEFLEMNPQSVETFLAEAKASADFTNENPTEAAAFIEQSGIVAKAAIAEKAIPMCNITYIDGAEMKTALSGYLQVLFDKDPKAVGGAMPADDFYFGLQ